MAAPTDNPGFKLPSSPTPIYGPIQNFLIGGNGGHKISFFALFGGIISAPSN